MILNSTVKMHAHKCEECAAKGKEVIWIHPDSDRGQVAAHRCPECGALNWKQHQVENGKLPQPLPKNETVQRGVNWDMVLGYTVLLIGLALIGYGVYIYIQGKKHGNSSGNAN